ncbi:hypothetical protein LNKW23_05240 [Paralimibaculum aggregatum]|uniref:Uncharacterized protein n=1 Tax=Paralimibaculum aggregatum TaxID=3036245 RepID=A0ABQ6LFX2_9RHOB|nr:hypothetical protein LNKW23_05240 [Limibaculum sp. NKW23]
MLAAERTGDVTAAPDKRAAGLRAAARAGAFPATSDDTGGNKGAQSRTRRRRGRSAARPPTLRHAHPEPLQAPADVLAAARTGDVTAAPDKRAAGLRAAARAGAFPAPSDGTCDNKGAQSHPPPPRQIRRQTAHPPPRPCRNTAGASGPARGRADGRRHREPG